MSVVCSFIKLKKKKQKKKSCDLQKYRVAMEETFVPFRGIKNDLKERLVCYKQDWTGGIRAGIRFVPSSVAMFCL